MECYYKDPAATAEILIDGWLHTGDMARQDEDDFYWLVDRKKDVIVMGGENLYPCRSRTFSPPTPPSRTWPSLACPTSAWERLPAAIIELKPGYEDTTEDDINEFCLALPRYKRPRKVIFAEVPRNPTGKIEKPLLRERYGAAHLVDQENKA